MRSWGATRTLVSTASAVDERPYREDNQDRAVSRRPRTHEPCAAVDRFTVQASVADVVEAPRFLLSRSAVPRRGR